MQKQKAITDYSQYNDDEIVDVGRLIETEMGNNVVTYPTPPVGIPILGGQIDSYEGIKAAPVYPNKTEDQAVARTLINTSLHDIAVYVNTIAKGDLVKLGLSGCPISELITPQGDRPAPLNMTIKNGAPLSFDMSCATVEGAYGYLFALTPVTNTETDPNLWRIVWSSKHTRTVGGNADGTRYKFAACAVATTDNINWLTSGTTLFAQ